MQFDKTRIAVRERNFLDILDLALWVIRDHAWPFTVALFLGAAPFAVLNIWLLGGENIDILVGDTLSDSGDYVSALTGYFTLTAMLVVFEMPLATSLVTLYLGAVLFDERPSVRQLAADFRRSLPQLFVFQILLRGVLMPWFITWFVLFAVWPNLNEVILLERNPLTRRGPQGMSTLARNSALHAANSGELFGRWLLSLFVGLTWLFTIWMSIWWIRYSLTNQLEFDWAMYTVFLQLAIWLVVGYFAVVRYLSYLDLRIKSEGWEVELRMRAEAARLARQWN